MRQKEKTYSNWIIYIVYIIYIGFNVMLLCLHEPWRDEANVWLMARDLSPLQLLREIKYQGHPCLWYFLVMPFAKLGFSFRTIGVLSTLVMSVAAGVYLWKAPQWIGIKVLAVFSPIFTYFYPTIARNYCLVALFLILLAWNYSERNRHPIRYGILLGMLVQSDTIAVAPAGMIAFIWLVENICSSIQVRENRLVNCLKGLWIPLASLLFWILQFYRVSDSPVYEIQNYGISELLHELRNYAYVILIRVTGWNQSLCTCFFVVTVMLMLVVSWKLRNIGAMLVMLMSFLFQCMFSVMVYQLHIWHYISLAFVFLWMIWCMEVEANKNLSDKLLKGSLVALNIVLAILAIAMFLHWNTDEEASNLQQALHGSYSDGHNAAEFIQGNIDTNDILISTDVALNSTVLAYLNDYQCYYAGTGEITSYADWSEEQCQTISVEELLLWCRDTFPMKQEVYLIQGSTSCITDGEQLEQYEVVYETSGTTVRGEEYKIYKITF